MPITESDFRRALSSFASGVTVVTTVDAEGGLHGLTVSAFCSVSLSPPMVLVCIEKATASHFAFLDSGVFVVHTLDENQRNISEHFATPIPDKFSGLNLVRGIGGCPILEGTLTALECRIVNCFDGGDHSIFVGVVENAVTREGHPLLYFRGGYRSLDGETK